MGVNKYLMLWLFYVGSKGFPPHLMLLNIYDSGDK